MTHVEKDDLIGTIARNPKACEVIPRTGGVRKLRVAREGQGKSGSFRLIYYYYDKKNPVFQFTVFGKNEKTNITDAEKRAYYKGIHILKKEMKP
ncbi:MAG: hypothetical protein NPIRA01_09950 [Nitrospirales bacterium]|nr:MAG: hypothetical protein NPIRA01_09950 [Nitrospirales bacterium]